MVVRGWVSRIFFLVVLAGSARAYGAFGVTTVSGTYQVDTGAGLVFRIKQTNGDMVSLKLNGNELQDQTKFSHISSGLGTATVTAQTFGTSYIKITCTTSTLTHYYVARNGFNIIYMATYISAEPSVGELRYIARLQKSKLPNGPTPSAIAGGTAIESDDVFLVNGQTRSKFYGNERAMELTVKGATGSGVGVFSIFGQRESSSGGPFFRDIENQGGAQQEVYNYMNSGHYQTEAFRINVLHGPYFFAVTNGSTPSAAVDYSFMSTLGLTGWVANRGRVTGTVSGIPGGEPAVVGWANSTAQYWVAASGGSFTSPWMKPGTYTMTLYRDELAVATTSVTVPASPTPVSKNISSTISNPSFIWQIGAPDGTPQGMKNASNMPNMHPSDSRQGSWGPVTYTVGSSPLNTFPAAQWKEINNPTTVKFNLSSGQVAAHNVRIGITCAHAGGRPQITVNSWTSPIPSPSSQPSTRSLTLGTYRGNNTIFTYSAPASAFVAGQNTMTITVVSGSSGTGFLSPGYAYDFVELDN